MVGATAGLQYHLRRILFDEEGFHLGASELAPRRRALLLIDTMKREHVPGRIDRDALVLHLDGPWLVDDNSALARDAVGPSTPTTGATADTPDRPESVMLGLDPSISRHERFPRFRLAHYPIGLPTIVGVTSWQRCDLIGTRLSYDFLQVLEENSSPSAGRRPPMVKGDGS
jgi:hypothetical protein